MSFRQGCSCLAKFQSRMHILMTLHQLQHFVFNVRMQLLYYIQPLIKCQVARTRSLLARSLYVHDAGPVHKVPKPTSNLVIQPAARLGISVQAKSISAVYIPYLGKGPSLEPWDRLHIHLKLRVQLAITTPCSVQRAEHLLTPHPRRVYGIVFASSVIQTP
jgi:hypothetical protein